MLFFKLLQNLTSINSSSQDDLDRIVTNTDNENLLASVRKRLQTTKDKIDVGSLNVLSAKYEVRNFIVLRTQSFAFLISTEFRL